MLKDLIIDVSKASEDAIEGVVTGYVMYDPKAHIVHLLPDATHLGLRAKVLLFLTAILGWTFVTEEVIPTSATPSEIERQIGIPGGSIRPTLRSLRDEKMIVQDSDGRYRLPTHSLTKVRGYIRKEDPAKLLDTPVEAEKDGPTKDDSTRTSRKSRKQGPGSDIAGAIDELIGGGWFDQDKTLGEFREELEVRGISRPSTHLSPALVRAVRSKKLQRSRIGRDGSMVYAYKIWAK